jgi:hypothetical protein
LPQKPIHEKQAHEKPAGKKQVIEKQSLPESPELKNTRGSGSREDRSIPVAWLVILVTGLLLIYGFVFLYDFFGTLLSR